MKEIERHVFDALNQYGELCPQQDKALEELGFELPKPNEKKGKYNNRKMVFDDECRKLFISICQKHGLNIDVEPVYGGASYLEKQDFIIMNQQKRIDEKQAILEGLVMKIEDVNAVVEEAVDLAYEKACEVVTERVKDFDKVLDGQKETLIFLITCEREYNRHSQVGDIGIRVQTSEVFSDPTANDGIERYEIDKAISESKYSEEFFREIEDKEYILTKIWELKLMRLEYMQLCNKILNLDKEETYIMESYLKKRKSTYELAEEFSVEPESIKQRVYRIRKHLIKDMLNEMGQYANKEGGRADGTK